MKIASEQFPCLSKLGLQSTHSNKKVETHCTISSKFFKIIGHVKHQLYEVELAKTKIEYTQPVVVGSFILQNAKLRLLELDNNFFDKLCDIDNFEELEVDTGFLVSALAEKEITNCI